MVVVNFLNRKNEADLRVFTLLTEKFSLFEGVFGASDEVLGAIESGVDFEKRIASIYQNCRTPDEIRRSFDELQAELTVQINDAMTTTRRKLLENFADEVNEKLRVRKDESEKFLNRYERMLMRLSQHELNGHAEFDSEDTAFNLIANPFPHLDIPTGRYELPRRSGEAHLYRLGHPLAEHLVEKAKARTLAFAEIVFDYHGTLPRVAAFQRYLNQAGELLVCRMSVESMDQGEDHLLIAAVTDDGEMIPEDSACKFFSLGSLEVRSCAAKEPDARVMREIDQQQALRRRAISERNGKLFEEEAAKLDGWADDFKVGLEREIKDLDRQMKEARRAASAALTLEEKLDGQRQVKYLESQRNAKRKSLFAAQDEIEEKRDTLIRQVEGKLEQAVSVQTIIAIRWNLC